MNLSGKLLWSSHILTHQNTELRKDIHYLIEELLECLSIPGKFRLHQGISRYYFRESMRNHLPLKI